jgi:methyltransferase (TIGR00027 family)
MSDIENISDTALWVAAYRALESRRPDALFNDPFAEKLAGERGFEIARGFDLKGQSFGGTWAIAVRTAVIDELVLKAVSGGVDTVLDLAAGLDCRAFRLNLPAELKWIDVDLPGILRHKTEKLAGTKPKCQYRPVELDLSDGEKRKAFFAEVAANSGGTLILAEGIMMYLTEEQAVSLAQDLSRHSSFKLWIQDYLSPMLLKILSRRWGERLNRANAPFQFAPEEGPAFFERTGWKVLENRSILSEAERLRREPSMHWLWKLARPFSLPSLRRKVLKMNGIALLRR